jgi:TRAP-type C4-dicarboxylate transport system permease small subunit
VTALAIVVVVGVGFRKAGASLIWYDEVASILLAWLTYYGAALAALHRAHIGMPTLVDRLSGAVRKTVVLAGEACTLAFFGVLTWAGFRVLSVLGGTTLVSLPAVPAAIAQSVIPIGALLFIMAQLLSLPEALAGSDVRVGPELPVDPEVPERLGDSGGLAASAEDVGPEGQDAGSEEQRAEPEDVKPGARPPGDGP